MTLCLKPVSRLVNRMCRAPQSARYGLLVGSLFLAPSLYAQDSDGDGITDADEGAIGRSVSSGFEDPVIAGDRNEMVLQANLPLWSTTETQGKIEVWKSGFGGVPSFEGDQHVEIEANGSGALFIDIETVPGETLDWQVAHRGRLGVDTATVSAGVPGLGETLLETLVTDNTAWESYNGTYVVPAGQAVTRLTFAAVNEDGTGGSGNFLDGFVVSAQARDTDGDGTADYLDNDSDNDGITDEVEYGAGEIRDADSDGISDYLEVDSDDDGILDSEEGAGNGTRDTDGDTVPDYRDRDSDNDRIADLVEGNGDYDGDGIPDYLDIDSDGDTIPDLQEGTFDSDGNGVPDYLEPSPLAPGDWDADGLLDDIEGDADSDGDGLLDFQDSDSDNDGIPDQVEGFVDGQGPADTDADGVYDFRDVDSDNDGIPDLTETTSDFDADGIANYRDVDSDDDGISDLVESHPDYQASESLDTNRDGMIDIEADSFGSNGMANSLEETVDAGETNYEIANSDSDTQPDYLDRDSDNDGLLDTQEALQLDADLNGVVDEVLTTWGFVADQDADGVADYRDLDSDNDGLSDLQETVALDSDGDGRLDGFTDADLDGVDDMFIAVVALDSDGDGLANHRDLDSDQDGIADVAESGGPDTNLDGLVDDLVDLNGDGISDELLETPLALLDDDADGSPNYLDLDSDNNGLFDLVESGEMDIDNDGMVDDFTDPDGNGLNKVQFSGAGNGDDDALLFTGVTGGVGCVLSSEKSPFDPLFLLVLLFAGLGLRGRKH